MRKSKSISALIFLFIGIFLLVASNFVDELRVYQGAQVAVYVIAISSIILLTGFSGQISLGHGALMAIGGYAAVLSYSHWHVPFLIAFVIGSLAAALAGFVLGLAAARLSGPYLAGTTLALAVGLPSLANQFHLLGGEQGLSFDIGEAPAWITHKTGGDFTQYKWFFWISTVCALITIWFIKNLLQSRFGRTWKAVRGNPSAAALSGINIGQSKVLAFTLSSALAGLSGALLAMLLGLVAPMAFTLTLSFTIVTGAVLAGVTNLSGSIVGALVLVVIPELADAVATHLGGSEKISANLPGLITSVLLILTVLFAPNGPQLHKSKKVGNPSK
jgi:branched-chain amino acid transport system permease protein